MKNTWLIVLISQTQLLHVYLFWNKNVVKENLMTPNLTVTTYFPVYFPVALVISRRSITEYAMKPAIQWNATSTTMLVMHATNIARQKSY